MNTLYLPEIREMLTANDKAGLADFCSTLHPTRTAEYMEGLTLEETWNVLKCAKIADRIDIFSYLPDDRQIEMLETLDRKEMAGLIGELPPDERVDLLDDLQPQVVEEILPLVSAVERRDIERIQSYHENTAGGVMTTEIARLSEDMTVDEVREKFHEWGKKPQLLEMVYYLYVVDDGDRLRGVVSFRDLAYAAMVYEEHDKKMSELMQSNVIAVKVDDDQEVVANVIANHDLLAVPVVDQDYRLLGIVTHDDVIDVVREEATEDVQMIGAVHPLQEGYLQTGLLSLTWKRVIWLMILFFAAIFTASALQGYEETTARHAWLVMFIPLIISSGGNSGNQAASLVISALNSDDVKLSDWARVVRREIIMGMLLGACLAITGLMVSGLMTGDPYRSFIIFCTLFLVVLAGSVTGASLPLLFSRLGLDPSLMSNPFVAGIMDILGICIYMNVALLVLGPALGN